MSSPGELAGDGVQPHQLAPQPAPPRRVELVGAGPTVEVDDEAGRAVPQLPDRQHRLGIDPRRQAGGSVVRVDQPVEVAPEPQAELEVPGDGLGRRGALGRQRMFAFRNSTAWPHAFSDVAAS